MSQKPKFPPLAALAAVLHKLAPLPSQEFIPTSDKQSPASNESANVSELTRIANALERIAAALEKANLANQPAFTDLSQPTDNYWITLPDTMLATPDLPPIFTVPNKNDISPTTPSQTKPTTTLSSLPKTPAISPQEKSPISQTLDNSALPSLQPVPKPVSQNGVVPKQLALEPKTTALPPSSKLNQLQNSLPTPNQKQAILRKYLAINIITIQESKTPSLQKQIYQDKLDELAVYLGKNFIVCQELYNLLKKNMVAPRNIFNYSLKGATLDKNKIIQDFCRLLQKADLLDTFDYQGKPDYNFQLKSSGKEQKYLSGSWLEIFVKVEVARIANIASQPYEALPNLQIIFKNSSKTELDLFFAIGQRIFCIETKMRPGLAEVKNYLNGIKQLKLDSKNILIVVADKTEEECLKISKASDNIKIIQIANLERTLLALIK